MQHRSPKSSARCARCGLEETETGAFPQVVGVGRVCLECGMSMVKCEACGIEVKLLTSSRLHGSTLCLADHMKEVEKYRRNIIITFDEDVEPVLSILSKALSETPEGYILLAVRRGRNSTHLWEAEYEKTEIFQMRCS